MRNKLAQLFAGIALLVSAITTPAQSSFPSPPTNAIVLTDQTFLSWSPNPEANVLGYRLRITTPAGTFSTELTNRFATNITVKAVTGTLTPGTHVVALTAVNSAGLESAPATITTNAIIAPSTPQRFKIEGTITLTPIP